ncbi:hypothetical protein [Streptomyces yunnanensis]|uniref:Uncharacterized protein n=1 Tax=Streptomyces yunnanensis TaxID=156453 RepID=A0A9X8QMI7_9ACTN|nr:hypothetical protein [Streptomyces yunnanensis]SHK75644.1 hypothetical protein SAMN05216268_101215 [Streptomyces yunnanensis]
MSNTGDQNNPFSVPQPPPGYRPTPAQQNPYARPIPQGTPPGAPPAAPRGPGGYGYPGHPAAGSPGMPGAAGAPAAPGVLGAPGVPGLPRAAYGAPSGGTPGGTARRGVSGWLWALGGAVAATAIGTSVMFATGAFSSAPDPELKGYAFRDDLCAATSLTPFENAHYKAKPNTGGSTGSRSGSGSGPSSPPNPQHSGSRMNSMDSMWCNISLTPETTGTNGYSSTWVYNSVTLHKKADPGPEFADTYRSYEKQQTSISYKVEPVSGIGDEAYLVTRSDTPGSNNSRYVILAVRDGWMTYQSTWSSYTPSSGNGKPPSSAEIATMLESSAKETFKRLRG